MTMTMTMTVRHNDKLRKEQLWNLFLLLALSLTLNITTTIINTISK